jgi:hypothetical protein
VVSLMIAFAVTSETKPSLTFHILSLGGGGGHRR